MNDMLVQLCSVDEHMYEIYIPNRKTYELKIFLKSKI